MQAQFITFNGFRINVAYIVRYYREGKLVVLQFENSPSIQYVAESQSEAEDTLGALDHILQPSVDLV